MIENFPFLKRDRKTIDKNLYPSPVREDHQCRDRARLRIDVEDPGKKRRGSRKGGPLNQRSAYAHIAVRHREDRLELVFTGEVEALFNQSPTRIRSLTDEQVGQDVGPTLRALDFSRVQAGVFTQAHDRSASPSGSQ